MKRVAVIAGAALLGGLGFVALAPSAQADPVVCVNIVLDLNGAPVPALALCLPPDGAPPIPGLPGLPGLPIPV